MNAIDQVVLYILIYSLLGVIFLLSISGNYAPQPTVQAETVTKHQDRLFPDEISCWPDGGDWPSCYNL